MSYAIQNQIQAVWAPLNFTTERTLINQYLLFALTEGKNGVCVPKRCDQSGCPSIGSGCNSYPYGLVSGGVCEDSFCNYTSTPRIMFKCPAINDRGEDLIYYSFLGSKIDFGYQNQIIWAFQTQSLLIANRVKIWVYSQNMYIRLMLPPKQFWLVQNGFGLTKLIWTWP